MPPKSSKDNNLAEAGSGWKKNINFLQWFRLRPFCSFSKLIAVLATTTTNVLSSGFFSCLFPRQDK